ncbi:MAG TPA: FHA domain-containing protein [Paraburkholderia sp.]|jgi:hypothetical protein
MSAGAVIVVTGGVHAGANVLLSDGHDLTIGSGDGADLVLVDEHVEPHHATIRVAGDVLSVVALHDGVSVFGYPLRPGKPTALRYGAWFAVGGATLQFSGRDALMPATVQVAELSWLLTHAPLAYAARRWATLRRGWKLVIALAPLAVAAGCGWQLLAPYLMPRDTPHAANPAFRLVRIHVDAKSGVPVYEGYVETYADLTALAIAARSAARSPVLRVFVVSQLKEQLQEFLDKYYRGAAIRPGQAGAFSIVVPATDAYLQPESWDYPRVARLARAGIDGLGELSFDGHPASDGSVRIPLEAIGMNLTQSPNAIWLTDRQGQRYFAGARLPLGKVLRLSGCVAVIARDDDGTAYEFFSKDAHDKKDC